MAVNKLKHVKPGDAKIGNIVRQLRMRKGWSQEKLGDELGVTFQQIQKYEKGANRISGSRLVTIANLFEVSIDRLCGNEGGKQTPMDDVVSRFGSTRAGIAFATSWDKIGSPLIRNAFVGFAEAIAATLE